MRFCPHCGAPLMAGAKFCVDCGRQLAEPAELAATSSSSSKEGAKKASAKKSDDGSFLTGVRITNTFIAVFFGITIVGLGAAAYLLLSTPFSTQGPPPQSAQQQAGTSMQGQLPPGHPKITLPTEARTFIDNLQKKAEANPTDVKTWVKLGEVSMRAALFDNSYYDLAEKAYGHVLKLAPNNTAALRGIGDIYYDRNKYDEAAAAYEHYLKEKPNDPEVLTDLGTMYLYNGNVRQAIKQYKKAVSINPKLFQAYYNLGVAYGENGDTGDAAVVLTKAISLAPDKQTRKQTIKAFTKIVGQPPPKTVTQVASSGNSSAAPSSSSASSAAPVASAKTFRGAVDQMLKNLPVAGRKVTAVQWPSDYRVRVLMSNFPMNAMPPFARAKFLSDIKTGLETAKKDHKVTASVQIDLVDSASGKVMQTVTE